MSWTVGYKFQSRPYVIEGILGHGGFGITYKVRHLKQNEHFVIKTPLEHLKQDQKYGEYLRRFQKEGEKLKRLCLAPHPHIVQVIDFFREAQNPCLVMEYIPGENLYDLVKGQGALTETQAVTVICQIGEALNFMHQAELVHRDATPLNMMMRTQQEAVLIDFGIAKGINPKTSTQTDMAGNRSFAPYEQVGKGSRQKTVDVYSLAASLYYAVTGECATSSLGRKMFNEKLVPPSELVASISDRTNQAIVLGMALEPEERPQSIQEWLNLLGVTVSVNQVSEDGVKKTNRRQQQGTTITPPTLISRQQFLKWAGLGGGGLVTAVVVGKVFNGSSPAPQNTPSPTPQNTKNPETISVAEPKYIPPTEGGRKALGLPQWTVEFETVKMDARGEVVKRNSNQKAQFFKEDLGNGISLEMVEIPGGSFNMGSPAGEKGRRNFESPQHEVKVPTFFMGRFEVTQQQYQQVMGENPSRFKGDKHPVELVSWNEAVEFCKKLSQRTKGRSYSLPSEAQWEYACRAGEKTPFYFGETLTDKLANYDATETYASEPAGEYRQKSTPVGSFPANGFGLYDMHGNVWEWCADDWHENYDGAPTDGSAWIRSNDSNSNKVLRGGSWYILPYFCRCASRIFYFGRDVFYSDIGFRVVCVGARTT